MSVFSARLIEGRLGRGGEAMESDEAAAAFAAAEAICRRRDGDLYLAWRLLPRDKRRGAWALCAFGRMIADALAADDADLGAASGLRDHPAIASPAAFAPIASPEPAPVASCGGASGCGPTSGMDCKLDLFRNRLDDLYAGRLQLPAPAARSESQHALHAVSLTLRRWQIPRQAMLDLAEGWRMRRTVARYPTWTRLDRYCTLAGGSAALALGCVLGFTHSDSGQAALRFGAAIELTRVLRDIGEDLKKGRIFLPLEDLAAFRYGEKDLARGTVDARFHNLMRFQIARARRLLRDGADSIPWLADDRARLSASLIAVHTAATLTAIERTRYDVLHHPPTVLLVHLMTRLPTVWRLARRRGGEPLPWSLTR